MDPVLDPTCAFCQILDGETDAHVVADDPAGLAFLDRRPLFPGHTLVVPRTHLRTLTDLPPSQLGPYFALIQRLSAAVPAAAGAVGTFVAMNNTVSQSVPHLHVHVVPRNPKDGLRGFFWPRTGYRDEEHAAEVAASIRDALDGVVYADDPGGGAPWG